MNTHPIIYIIDDDPDNQEFLIEAIKEIDLSIVCYTAMNGQEWMNRLETDAVPFPSLIFLVFNMPHIDERKFLIALKHSTRFKSIPVIIYSTSTNLKDKDKMLQLGAIEYIIKEAEFALLK